MRRFFSVKFGGIIGGIRVGFDGGIGFLGVTLERMLEDT
jgi:hypothetical protein